MYETRPPRVVEVFLEPENKTLVVPWPKTVLQLLHKLALRTDEALVIRDGGLLTPDRKLFPGDAITVRVVTSRG